MNFPFTQAELLTNAILTLLLVAAVILLRTVLVRAILRQDFADNVSRRRLAVNVRNTLLFLLIVGLVGIWAQEVQNFALSVVAFAAATVVATRELINCAMGSFFRTGTNAFSVGDRIEIDGRRGEVIDLTLWSTTILEIGPANTAHPYTGRTVVIPSSILLAHPVVNESFMKPFVIHTISIPMTVADDWQAAEKALLSAAEAQCAEYLAEAREKMKRIERTHALDSPSVEPRVSLQIPEAGKLNLVLRVPVPVRRRGRVEQEIVRRFLREFPIADGELAARRGKTLSGREESNTGIS